MSGSSFLILDCPPGKAGVNSKQNQVNNLLINSQSATNTTKATVTLEFNDQQRQTHKTSRQDVNSQAESKSINQQVEELPIPPKIQDHKEKIGYRNENESHRLSHNERFNSVNLIDRPKIFCNQRRVPMKSDQERQVRELTQ